mgnify:CR=1 FL=1
MGMVSDTTTSEKALSAITAGALRENTGWVTQQNISRTPWSFNACAAFTMEPPEAQCHAM